MAMQILGPGNPESNLVIPVVGAHSDGYSLVITTLADNCTIMLFTIRGQLDVTSP